MVEARTLGSQGSIGILSRELAESLDEALTLFGKHARGLFQYYAVWRYSRDLIHRDLTVSEFDEALVSVFGNGRRIIVNRCAKSLSRRLGREIVPSSDSLVDLLKQSAEMYGQARWVSQSSASKARAFAGEARIAKDAAAQD